MHQFVRGHVESGHRPTRRALPEEHPTSSIWTKGRRDEKCVAWEKRPRSDDAKHGSVPAVQPLVAMVLEEIVIDPPKVSMSVDDSGLCPIVIDIDGEIGFHRRTALLKPLKRSGVATCVQGENRCGPQLVLAPIHAAT